MMPKPHAAPGNDYRSLGVGSAMPSATVVVVGGVDPEATNVSLASLEAQSFREFDVAEALGQPGTLNAAVEEARGDVVVFMKAGSSVEETWLEGHLRWHARASNVVVCGSVGSSGHGWRNDIQRRSQGLVIGDDAYRIVDLRNVSVRRNLYRSVGGVDTSLEDLGLRSIELGWRLWNAGAFIVPDAAVPISGPPDAELAASSLLANLVPHRSYRAQASHLFDVPKVSWIVTAGSPAEIERAWTVASECSFTDTEVVLAWPSDGEPERSFGEAVRSSRGEILAIVDGRSTFDRRLLARAVKRFDDPMVDVVRVAYSYEDGVLLTERDLTSFEETHGRDGLPFFALVRRRELMKDPSALSDPLSAWAAVLHRSAVGLHTTDVVDVPHSLRPARRRRLGRSKAESPSEEHAVEFGGDDNEPDVRPVIRYVGFLGHHNLGDDAMLEATKLLLPDVSVGTDASSYDAVMLGGGTLLNSDRFYLTRVQRVDGPSNERFVFGTGMRSPAFWGETETFADWEPFLASAISVGVRGPHTLESLEAWGFAGRAEVIGDPALAFERPEDISAVDGQVVISLLDTGGSCWGGDDGVVVRESARLIATLRAEGRSIVLLTANPQDDRWAAELMADVGLNGVSFVPGYRDIDRALRVIAASDLVVGERLHAVVLAAAMGTPFVAIEYRPKVLDFCASIGAEARVVRTDQIAALADQVASQLASPGTYEEEVRGLRLRLRARASEISSVLLGTP